MVCCGHVVLNRKIKPLVPSNSDTPVQITYSTVPKIPDAF